jgi:hypothetical protein
MNVKKFLSVLLFFLLAAGIIYVITNLNPSDGITIDDFKKIFGRS